MTSTKRAQFVVSIAAVVTLPNWLGCAPESEIDRRTLAVECGDYGDCSCADYGDPCMGWDDPGTPPDNDNCRGECGRGCDGIAGKHFCTPECRAHDDCYRDCLESSCLFCNSYTCSIRCAATWYQAYQSWWYCYFGPPGACACPW